MLISILPPSMYGFKAKSPVKLASRSAVGSLATAQMLPTPFRMQCREVMRGSRKSVKSNFALVNLIG
jgi:hypothetical protein